MICKYHVARSYLPIDTWATGHKIGPIATSFIVKEAPESGPNWGRLKWADGRAAGVWVLRTPVSAPYTCTLKRGRDARASPPFAHGLTSAICVALAALGQADGDVPVAGRLNHCTLTGGSGA